MADDVILLLAHHHMLVNRRHITRDLLEFDEHHCAHDVVVVQQLIITTGSCGPDEECGPRRTELNIELDYMWNEDVELLLMPEIQGQTSIQSHYH